MLTISELAETLCGALGLNPDLGSLTIEYLTKHDLLPETADEEAAAKLLTALAASGSGWAPHKLVE